MFSGIITGVVTGIIAGFIACKLFDGQGKGCLVNLFLGVVGGALGGWLFSLFGLGANSWIGELIVAVIGAMVFLWVWNKLLK
ncbi:MAG: GlsB/YeaQ/YmgE family stress response membrane protein [Bacteroidaceae bacterium]|nr:GlsB/YeaQ/YmgE family stress response membrane protein [Bacteroidaceae bacterium]